jgi:2-polyprenyl-3-methyl-5-hydroxy-6-metoxy-1,4-benzoquinol methylase
MKIYHKLVRADNPDVTKFISKFIPPGKGLALDVGCGEGYLSKILKEKGYFVIGIDIDSQMLKIARKNCHKIMKVDITKGLPFKDCSFNFLLCSDVLEHIDNPIFVLK